MKFYSDEIELVYQTRAEKAAPYAFQCVFLLKNQQNQVQVLVQQHFTDRDQIPLEEIEAEGFTENDDFSWEGNLPKIWSALLRSLMEQSDFSEDLHDVVQLASLNSNKAISPLQADKWESFCEELLQACYESAGREGLMELVWGKLEKNNFYEQARILWSFRDRSVVAELLNGERKQWSETVWQSSRQALQAWIEREASKKDLFAYPSSKGWYWLLNQDIWLTPNAIGEGIVWDWIRTKFK